MSRKLLYAILPGLLAVAALVVAGCSPTLSPSGGESPLSTPPAVTEAPPQATPGPATAVPSTPTAEPPAVPPEAQALVDQAVQELAGQLDVAAETITLVSVRAVDWSDASLGCPEPGKAYAQVITPGYEIILEASGQRYSFHTSTTDVVLCLPASPGLSPTPPVTGTAISIDPTAVPLVEMAKQELAKQLGISAAEIVVGSVNAVEWRDSSLGCPQKGVAYLTVITPGYLIKLQAGGRGYEYHSDQKGRVVTCDNPQAPYSIR